MALDAEFSIEGEDDWGRRCLDMYRCFFVLAKDMSHVGGTLLW